MFGCVLPLQAYRRFDGTAALREHVSVGVFQRRVDAFLHEVPRELRELQWTLEERMLGMRCELLVPQCEESLRSHLHQGVCESRHESWRSAGLQGLQGGLLSLHFVPRAVRE